jgi:hypothetical protein
MPQRERPAAPRKQKFTDSFVKSLKPLASRPYAVWDVRQQGLLSSCSQCGHRAFSLSIHVRV